MTVRYDGWRGASRVVRFLSFLCLLGMGLLIARPVRAEVLAQSGSSQAGVVVQFDNGSVEEYCVDVGADGVATGEEVLEGTGLPIIIEYSGMGGAVCKVGSTGCDFPADSCFCECTLRPGEACTYWGYSHLKAGEWTYSRLGAANYEVTAGSVEGWSWGGGDLTEGSTPPIRTFDQICAAAAPTSTPTVTPSATSLATATASATVIPTTVPPIETPRPTGTLIPPTASATGIVPTATVTTPVLPSATTTVPSATATLAPSATTAPVSTPAVPLATDTVAATEVPPTPGQTSVPATETVMVIPPTATPEAAPTISSPNVTLPTPTLIAIAVVPTNANPPLDSTVAVQSASANGRGDWWLYGVFGLIVVGLLGIGWQVWRYRDGA